MLLAASGLVADVGFSASDVSVLFGLGTSTHVLNAAVDFHVSSGHPSKSRMHDLLSKGLIRNPKFTHADIRNMPDECAGCELGHARRQPFKGTHAAAKTDRDVVVYVDTFGKTQTAAVLAERVGRVHAAPVAAV